MTFEDLCSIRGEGKGEDSVEVRACERGEKGLIDMSRCFAITRAVLPKISIVHVLPPTNCPSV